MNNDPTRTAAPHPADTASLTPTRGEPGALPDVPGYEIEAVLGRGGMGVVYKARQVATNRTVAVKMLPAGGDDGAAARARFRAEAEATAKLSHPHIVPVFEAGEVGGRAYLVCEYLPGGSLAGQLDGTPWAAERAARVAVPLARAVAAAHAAGIVHRDLKPSNVLLAADGVPKVADFGVAKQLGADSHTHTGAVLGTPSYMAPEQAGGAKTVGPAADVYGLGAVLYELVTGRPPFKGADLLDTLDQVRTREPVPPRALQPKLPRDLETITLKCLEKAPDRRYPSADALADDLDRFLAGRPITARPVGAWERTGKWVRRNKAVSAATAAVALALAAGVAVSTWFALAARRAADRATANEQVAHDKAVEAAADRDTARAAERESRRRMVRLNILTGTRSLDAGDPAAALLWFHQAWELDRPDPVADPSHRARIAGLLRTLPDLVGVCFHPVQVLDAAFAPDGTRLLARTETAVYLWDPERSRLTTPPLTHSGRINHAGWAPDGSAVATASADGTAAVWDARTGERRHTFTLGGPVTWAAFHPDGRRVVTAAEDRTVRLWDATNGKSIDWPFPAGAVIDHVAVSPDGSRLVTSGRDDVVRVWSFDSPKTISPPLPYRAPTPTERYRFHYDRWPRFAPDGKSVASFKGEDLIVWPGEGTAFQTFALGYSITEVHWVPGADALLATGAKYNRVAVVRAADGKDVHVLSHPRQANVGAVAPDGKYLFTASSGGVIHLWDAATGRPAWPPQRCGDFASAVGFSPDGKRCFAASQDGTLRVWAVVPRPPEVVPYSPDGRANNLVLPADDGRTRAYGPDGVVFVEYGGTGVKLVRPGTAPAAVDHPGPIGAVFFSDDGSRFVIHGGDSIRAFDARTGQSVGPAVGPARRVNIQPDLTTGERAAIDPGRLSRDATRAAVWEDERTVSVWDLTAGRRVFGPFTNDPPGEPVFGERVGYVTGLALSADGRRLALATDSAGTLGVWDVDAGRELHRTKRFKGFAQGFGFSADGRRVLLWASDNVARVYDAETGGPVGPGLRPPLSKDRYARVHPNECAVSSDGRRLAFYESGLGTVRVWDADRADSLFAVPLPGEVTVARMWFAPDDARVNLVAGGKALSVIVPRYDVPADLSGRLVGLLAGHRIDETDGIEALPGDTFRNDPATHRKAFLAWKGRPDDPTAQPPR